MPQPNENSGKRRQVVEIRVYLPLKLSKRLATFTDANHLVSKSMAIVKILEERLFPLVNGDVA